MCYRNGYGCSCGCCEEDVLVGDLYLKGAKYRSKRIDEEVTAGLNALQKICDLLIEKQLHIPDGDPVFMVAYTPGEPMKIIKEDEAEEYLPCYDVDDVIEQAPGSGLVLSYDSQLLFSVDGQKYLDGTFLIYALDDDGFTESLEIGDLYQIQKMVEERTINVTQSDEEMPVFSMN